MPVSWLLRTEHSLLAIGAVNAQFFPIYWQDMRSMIYPLLIDILKEQIIGTVRVITSFYERY